MTKQLYGFASVFMLILMSFLIVFTTISWRSVSYVHQLASDRAVFQQNYCDAHTACMQLITLSKTRFDQIMYQLTKTGNEITFSRPSPSKKCKSKACIKKVNGTELFIEIELAGANEHIRAMKCSCKMIKESQQEVTGTKITYKILDFTCA